MKIKLQFLRWLIGWADLLQGLILIFSLGYLNIGFGLWMSRIYAREKYKEYLPKGKVIDEFDNQELPNEFDNEYDYL